MTDNQLLSYLEQEMKKSKAIALGMEKAYHEEFYKEVKRKLAKRDIYLTCKVKMSFTNGDTMNYRLERLEFDPYCGDVLLYGSRYLKKEERLAKERQQLICYSKQIDHLTRV